MGTIRKAKRSIVTLASMYSGAAGSEFTVPEDLTTLSDEELETLHSEAVEHFNATYGDGVGLDGATLTTLGALTDAVEALSTERATREQNALASQEQAAALAARVGATLGSDPEGDDAEGDAEGEGDEDADADAEGDDEGEDADKAESLVASGRKRVIKLPSSNSRNAAASQAVGQQLAVKKDMKTLVFAKGEGLGVPVGTGMDFTGLGRALDKRLGTFNLTQYQNASKMGREIREVGSLAAIQRPIPTELMITSNDTDHVDKVLSRATSEKHLKGGSLVASGGWHAPSEVLYEEFLELESRDGILSLPEVGVARGGVSITAGPNFADLYRDITGFHFTEADDIAGNYAVDAEGNAIEGVKPTYHVEGPEFTEYRLEVDGLIITSGLLGARGYPEHLARVIRGALVAHDHRINAAVIGRLVAGSTAVAMTAGQIGAAAPVLTAIELQTEHYRTSHRMGRNTTVEGVFPYWVRGAIRSDLSRRLGVELLDVPDSRIDGWFRSRNIVPQYVYDWQSIDIETATAFNAWPTSVSFLLYAAGTWVKGISELITLDTIYDSVLLGKNDFTALFTEEGWFAAKRGHDSRVVTVPISATGATHIGMEIAHNGTEVPAPTV